MFAPGFSITALPSMQSTHLFSSSCARLHTRGAKEGMVTVEQPPHVHVHALSIFC